MILFIIVHCQLSIVAFCVVLTSASKQAPLTTTVASSREVPTWYGRRVVLENLVTVLWGTHSYRRTVPVLVLTCTSRQQAGDKNESIYQ